VTTPLSSEESVDVPELTPVSSPPAPVNNDPLEPTMTPQTVVFPDKKSAQLLIPPAEAEAGSILTALGLDSAKNVLLIVGDSGNLGETARAYLVQLLSRGLVRVAIHSGAVIIDSGHHSGLTALVGRSGADRGRKSILLGVAPAGKIELTNDSPNPKSDERELLDPNHTHFVLTPGSQWGDEIDLMYRLTAELVKDKPAVTILINGDDRAKRQLLESVRHDWPVIIIGGTGGLANQIARLWRNRPSFIPDPDLAEIVADGNLHVFQLESPISAFERLLEQLSNYREGEFNTLELAWQRFAMYDANANRQQRQFRRLQGWALTLGVLATALVITDKQLELLGVVPQPNIKTILYSIVLLLPITMTMLIALLNRFSAGNKWIFSRAGAESLKKEIYRYRARAEIYSDQQTKTVSRDLKLTRKLDAISTKLMQTEVNTSAMPEYEGPIPPAYASADGDDGLSFLPPDRYLKLRLEHQLKYYRHKAIELEGKLRRLQWLIYGIGALGTLLVALRVELWIALTTGLATTLTTYLEYQKVEERLMRYNQTATDLANIQSWWAALSSEEQASPDNIDKLVGQTETAVHAEHAAWIQDMQDAMAELRAEQTKESGEAGQEEPTTEQKLIIKGV
jgi:hypothetical protein